MHEVIAAIFALFVSTSDAEALMHTARDTRLTVETAQQHIAAARFAAILTDTDPDLLLGIAHHESRYKFDVIGPLVRGKRACGVMQHTPLKRCPKPSLLRDYLIGARHLKEWIRAQRGNLKRALIGYAGGYALLEKCDRGEALRACTIANYHLARARRIQRARELSKERPGTRAHSPVPPS